MAHSGFRRLGVTVLLLAISGSFVLGSRATIAGVIEYKSGLVWSEPKVIDPGPAGGPPSDALVLFDGKDLSKWVDGEKWLVENGYAVARGKEIRTKASFGDCQLHVEWATPEKLTGSGQGRGNSGVFLMGRYEVQILDSYQNETYFDGQAASLYKQHPPLVNACRKPGEWQTYDIIFTAPRFDGKKLAKPGYVTLLHNGVLVQNHFELQGDTSYVRAPLYEAHPPKLPIELQFHGNPVRFRNIWIRELPEEKAPKFDPKLASPGRGGKPDKPKADKKPEKPKSDKAKPEKKKSDKKKSEKGPAKPQAAAPEKPQTPTLAPAPPPAGK